jgi:uncharacterized protein (DUF427 family)
MGWITAPITLTDDETEGTDDDMGMKAIWNGTVIAESDDTVVVEGNHYFPRESIDPAFFADSDNRSVCHWKGTASYFHVEVDGQRNPNAAWYYPEPSAAAEEIRDRVAFWRGVDVVAA